MWFDLLGFLWNEQFLEALLVASIAGAVGMYYYTKPDDHNNRVFIYNYNQKQPNCSPFKSMGRVLRYHAGSLAFGSLIVAIVQWIRIILAYIDKHTKALQNGNCLARAFFKVTRCCVCCLDCCLRFISRNAYILVYNKYIQIGIRGFGFYEACVKAYKYIMNNLALVGTLSGFSGIIVFLGKVTIAGMYIL